MAFDVQLEWLVGPHELSGVDHETRKNPYGYGYGDEEANGLRFVLDGVTFLAMEDPEDGYRSTLGGLAIVSDPPVTNVFAPVKVTGRMRAPSNEPYHDSSDEVIEFVVASGDVVLAVGTDNADDY